MQVWWVEVVVFLWERNPWWVYCPFLDCVAFWTHNVVWSCGLVTETRDVCVRACACVRAYMYYRYHNVLVGMEEEMCTYGTDCTQQGRPHR